MSGKKPRYQDYVIKDGFFIGEFEQMYRDFDEPWEQIQLGRVSTSKVVGLALLDRMKAATGCRRVLELGCGLGGYAHRIAELGFDVLGLDVSRTAVEKARHLYPGVAFKVGTLNDVDTIGRFAPDLVVMAEITWYVLPQLREFLDRLRAAFPNVFILHLLATYPPGVQKYGRDYFTDLGGILDYFGMHYVEFGQVSQSDASGGVGAHQTFFLGSWNSELVDTVAKVQ